MRARRGLTRLLAGAGAATGLVLLARVLGVRLLAQHGAVLASPNPRLVRLGSAVDLAHAASMVPFVASPRYGPAARLSGGLAAAYAAVALAVAPRSEGR